MKLAEIVKAVNDKKDQQNQLVEDYGVDISRGILKPMIKSKKLVKPASGEINHHHGAMHMMGIDKDSEEYEETSRDLDDLSQTNPALYQKIVNGD